MSDTQYQDAPVCPHCGYTHKDAWEWDLGPGLEGTSRFDCGECDKEFIVSREVNITYSTRKPK
jgi:hypothetical protein